MAFFALLWKARTIENYRLNYEKEKINSIIIGNTQIEQTLSQRWRHYQYDTQRRISETFRKWYPENSGVSNFFAYLRTDQTFLNFLLKSVIGFIVGIILTYLCFMFFMFQLSVSLINATILSSTIGVLLTLGLAFSYRIRCLVFLLIPQLFSRVGRYTLTCYALVLILTGPATNTLKNSEILSESMACSQEQIKTSMHQLDELMKKPYNFLKEYISLMMKRFKVITTQVKLMVVRLNRLVLSIIAVIQSSYSWLQSISDSCNSKLRSPRDRCSRILKGAFFDCQKKEQKIGSLCDISRIVQIVCETVEPYKAFCFVTDGMDESILASISKKLKDFTAQIRNLFYLKLDLQHTYSFGSNSSKSGSQVTAGIVTEIRNRADPLLTWLSWSSCVTSLFLVLIIFRAKYYQHMYETRSRFDNRYVTKEFRELDLKRQRQGRETVLPLNKRERAKYITTTSFRLVAFEKIHLSRSALFMTITTFKLLIHMIADYSLYWVLMTIRHHGTMQSELMHGALQSGAYVTGEGYVAKLFTSILQVLDIPLTRPPPSPFPCLPDPYTPDFRRYSQIGVLIFLLWFFALFEPYGLRLRHVIMGQYKPERAKARANWLYYHILRSRCGFMKFARRKLHREYKYCTESSLTFRHWLDKHIPFQCLKYLLGLGPEEPHCLLCGTTISSNDTDTDLIRCKTPRCPGVYCRSCFSDIGQLCTICLSPADYGDQSDVSLERGSSDDSDSGSEFNETTHTDENTRLIEHRDRNRSNGNRSNTQRRHNFSCEYIKSETRHSALLETTDYKGCNLLDNFYTHYKKKSKFEHCYNEDEKVIDKKTDRTTKSVGVNTDKPDRLLKIMNFKTFKTQLTTWLKFNVPKFKIKVKHHSNNKLMAKEFNKTPINKNAVLNKLTASRNFLTFQVIFVRLFKNNKHSKIKKHINGEEGKNKVNYSNKDAESPAENKNNDINKNDNPDNNNEQGFNKNTLIEDDDNKVTKTEPSKKKTKEETKKVKMKTSKHKTNVQTFFSNRWQNIKPGIFDRTKNQIKPDTLNVKEQKNHKRRKKLKDDIDDDDDDILAVKLTPKMYDEGNRMYRISAFLADGDWMKNDYKAARDFLKESEVTDSSCSVNTANKRSNRRRVTVTANKLVTMMQFTNLPFQWGKPTELRYCQCYQRRKDSNYKLYQQKQNMKKALEKLRHKVNEGIISPSLSFIHKWINNFSITKESPSYDESTIDSEWRSKNFSDSTYYPKQPSFYGTWRNKVNYLRSEGSTTKTLYKNAKYLVDLRPFASHVELRDSSSIAKVVCSSSSYPTTTCNTMMIYRDTKQAYNTCSVAKECPEPKIEKKKTKMQKHPKKEANHELKKNIKSKIEKAAQEKSCEKTSSVKTLASLIFRKHDKNTSLRCGVSRPTTMEYNYYKINTTNACKAKKGTEKDAEKDKQLRIKYKDLEWAKVEEIDIHIEREKQIQEDILRELERHRCEEKRIVGDLACELARHQEREKRLMMDEGDELCCKAPLCLGPPADCGNVGESLTQISSGPSDLRLKGGIAQLTIPDKHAKHEVNPKTKCTCATQCVKIEKDSSTNADIYIREMLCQGLPSCTQLMRTNNSLLENLIPPNAKRTGACAQTSKIAIESSIERKMTILDKLKTIGKSNHLKDLPAIKDKTLEIGGSPNDKNLLNNVTTSTVELVASADCIETQVECKTMSKNKPHTHKRQAKEDQTQNLDKIIERDRAIEHLKASIYGDDDWYEYVEGNQDYEPKLDDLQIAIKSPTTVSTSSLQSDDTQTNSTTVCSVATLHYDEIRCCPRKKRYRVIAKVNRTTSMERAKFHNVGTETEYFWDPLLEKAENSAHDWRTGRVYLSGKRKKYNDNYRNIATDCGTKMREKCVQINSRPQVIPRGAMFECDDDILSPSRYLLQSQKYYNELFSIKLPRTQAEDVHNDARNQDRGEIPRPLLGRRHHQHKAKRMEKCCSPKILLSSIKQHSDSSVTIESPRRKPQPHRVNMNKYQEKQCSTRPNINEREGSIWPFKRS